MEDPIKNLPDDQLKSEEKRPRALSNDESDRKGIRAGMMKQNKNASMMEGSVMTVQTHVRGQGARINENKSQIKHVEMESQMPRYKDNTINDDQILNITIENNLVQNQEKDITLDEDQENLQQIKGV